MQLLWRTQDGQLLSRGAPQPPPAGDGIGAALFEQTHDFDRVDPATGKVIEAYRRRFTRFELKDAWYLTGHVVEGDALFELLFRVQLPEHHGGHDREILERAAKLTGLVPHQGRRWLTPERQHLIEGAPQTTAYGNTPPCDLLDGLHDYALVDPADGAVLRRFHRSDVLIGYSDTEVLTRHRVEDDALVEYVFDYYEDSCWGISHVRGHRRTVLLTGLVALSAAARPAGSPG